MILNFTHDCPDCKPIGNLTLQTGKKFDLYFCYSGIDLVKLTARFGNHEDDCFWFYVKEHPNSEVSIMESDNQTILSNQEVGIMFVELIKHYLTIRQFLVKNDVDYEKLWVSLKNSLTLLSNGSPDSLTTLEIYGFKFSDAKAYEAIVSYMNALEISQRRSHDR